MVEWGLWEGRLPIQPISDTLSSTIGGSHSPSESDRPCPYRPFRHLRRRLPRSPAADQTRAVRPKETPLAKTDPIAGRHRSLRRADQSEHARTSCAGMHARMTEWSNYAGQSICCVISAEARTTKDVRRHLPPSSRLRLLLAPGPAHRGRGGRRAPAEPWLPFDAVASACSSCTERIRASPRRRSPSMGSRATNPGSPEGRPVSASESLQRKVCEMHDERRGSSTHREFEQILAGLDQPLSHSQRGGVRILRRRGCRRRSAQSLAADEVKESVSVGGGGRKGSCGGYTPV